jgi:phage-related protein
MTDTFTWKPLTNATGTSALSLLSAQFGDGYSQDVSDGINPETQSWPLTFAGTATEMQAIVDFFRSHIGQRFFWTPFLGTQGLYMVPAAGWTINEASGIYTVTATFQEKFAP